MNIQACGDVFFRVVFNRAMVPKLHIIVFFLLAIVFGQSLLLAMDSQPISEAVSQEKFNRDILPIMKDFCFGCHGNERAKAELNLEAFGTSPDFFKDGRAWERVSEMLRHREMPPENKKQPTENQRILLTEFIDGELAKFDCSNPFLSTTSSSDLVISIVKYNFCIQGRRSQLLFEVMRAKLDKK